MLQNYLSVKVLRNLLCGCKAEEEWTVWKAVWTADRRELAWGLGDVFCIWLETASRGPRDGNRWMSVPHPPSMLSSQRRWAWGKQAGRQKTNCLFEMGLVFRFGSQHDVFRFAWSVNHAELQVALGERNSFSQPSAQDMRFWFLIKLAVFI
jgi:hypothetical protein